ncbi:MAG: hypothetical protein KDE54_18245 [Caldilineaceae bacterium]|nr:hypothetical protein [Caldilineaceae bacterium]
MRTLEDPRAARRLDRLEQHLSRLNQSILVAAGLLGGVWLYNAGNTSVAIGFWVAAGVLWWAGRRGNSVS